MVLPMDKHIVAIELYGPDDVRILFDARIRADIVPESRGEGEPDFLLAGPNVENARLGFILSDKKETDAHRIAGTVQDSAKLPKYVRC